MVSLAVLGDRDRAAIAGWELQLDGTATLADVWLNGEHLSHSENMFAAQRIAVDSLEHDNELVIRCGAVAAPRRAPSATALQESVGASPEPALVPHRAAGADAGLVTLGGAGRTWRPVRLITCPAAGMLSELALRTTCDESGGGKVSIAFAVRRAAEPPRQIWLEAGGRRAALQISDGAEGIRVSGRVALERVDRWWPHTHGAQPLYPVVVEIDGDRRTLRSVGFRELETERDGGAFEVRFKGFRASAGG